MATIVKGTYVQTAKKAAEFAADTTTIWSKNQLLIEEDTLKMKVGDGINVFSQLKYATVSPTEVQKLIADSSHSHINKAVLDQINQDMVERMQQEAVTPIANVKATDDGAEITITDYKGTTKAEIKNGKEINTYYNEEDETIYIGGDGGFSDLTQTQIEQIEKNKTNISSIKSNLIVYQNDTPSDDTTKVWLDSSNEDEDNITVPDMNDFNKLSSKVDSIINSGGGISNTAKNLLISILQNAVYTSNQKVNIEALTNALSSSSSTDDLMTIIYNLTNVTSTNKDYNINKGSTFTTALSAEEGYKINTVSVIMGDQDITTTVYSKDAITIPNVTGNINITAIAIKDIMFTAFIADFSGSTPNVDQFYSWEGRVYGKSVYDSLSNIRCENNIVYLTSVYNTDLQKWIKQMICTAGLFESDNFTCEFEAKYDEKAGSWQNVITYGTGTYWTNGLYSDGIKWPAGGEIDAFEQAGAYSDNPVTFCTPTAHYGSGRESGYINTIEHVRGSVLQFEPGKWQKYKFSLQNGHVDIYLNDVLKQSGDFSNCTVNNNYLYNYKPFLKPQAFYLDGSCADESNTNNSYEFAIKNFKIYQNEEVECTSLVIYPQMWDKGTTLVFPVGAELFMDKIFTPSNVSNKACKWESSNKTVATVVAGYVKTLTEGSTVITATCGNVKSTYTLTVSNTQKNIPCVGLFVEDQSKQLEVDEVVSFKTYVYPNFTTEKLIINGTNGIVEYDGTNLTAKKAGTATVTITCGSKQTSFNVSVKEKITDAHVLSYTFDNSTIGDNIVVENKGSLGSEYNLTVKCAKGPADPDTNIISTVSTLTIPTRSAGESYAIIMDLYDVLDRSVKKAIQGTGKMHFTEIESAQSMPQIGSTFENCSNFGPWQFVNNGNPSGFLIDNPCRVALWRDSYDKAYIMTSKDTEPQIISKDTANTYIKNIIKIKMNSMRINKLDIYYCDKTLDEIKALLND